MSQITTLCHKSQHYVTNHNFMAQITLLWRISGNTNGMVIDPYNQITGLDYILTL
jgi:hypothetical protein